MEAGWDSLVDEVWVTCSPEEQVFERLQRRNGLTGEEIRDRIGSQLPLEERVCHADVLVMNSGNVDELREELESLWRREGKRKGQVSMASGTRTEYAEYAIEDYIIKDEPHYRALGDEIELFEAAYSQQPPRPPQGPNWLWQDSFHRIHGLEVKSPPHRSQKGRQGIAERQTHTIGDHCLPRRPDRQ